MTSNTESSTMLEDSSNISTVSSVWNSNKIIYAAILVALYFIYSPILQTDFLYSDDYSFFTLDRAPNVTKITLGQARPLQGMMADLLNTTSIKYSGVKRLVSVVGLSCLALLLFNWLKYNLVKPVNAILIAVTICCMPSFHNITSYLTLTSLTYGSFLSGLSAYVFFKLWSGQEESRSTKALAVIASSALLFLALSCYQLNAMFCWVMIAISLLSIKKDNFEKLRLNVIYYCLLFGAVFLCYYLFYMKIVKMFLPSISQSGRSGLIASIPELINKMKWFYGDVIKYALIDILGSINSRLLMYPVAIVVVIVLIGSAVFLQDIVVKKYDDKLSYYFTKYVMLFLLVPLSYLPYMVIKESAANFMYLSTVEAIIFLYICIGITIILDAICVKISNSKTSLGVFAVTFAIAYTEKNSLGIKYTKNITTLGLLAITLIFAYSANHNLMVKYAMPNSMDYKYVKSQIIKEDLSKIKHVHIIGHLNFSEVLTYSENLVKVVLLDYGYANKGIKITSSSNIIPGIIHPEIFGRSEVFKIYYTFNKAHGYYNLRDDLTQEQRTTLLEYITSIPKALSQQQDVLIVDATNLKYMY